MSHGVASRRIVACLMASAAFIPAAALAQDGTGAGTEDAAPADNSGAIGAVSGNIIVTATKSRDPENVQDVPVAVTAFNADTLEALKIRDVQGLTYSAPNVSLDQIGTQRGYANFSIRGLGINSSIPSVDPTVGVFVDGVYLGVNAGVVLDLFDLESVELVRGPQGVLFGRNVTGGAVLINTGNPTEYFTGKFRASVDGPLLDSNRGGANYVVSGSVSGPLAGDSLLFKLGAYHNSDDGYFENQFDGSNHGAADTTILRGALEARLGDSVTVLAKADWFDTDGDGPAGQNHGTYRRDTFDFAIDETGYYETEIVTLSLRTDIDIGPGTLTNITGWRDYDSITDADIDALPTFIFHSGTALAQDQFSNELRYAASFDGLDFTIGGFYFEQDVAYDEERRIIGSPQSFGGGSQEHDVLGIFGQAQIYLTDALSVIAGLRWSHEEKDAAVTYVRRRPACSVVDGTCPIAGSNPYSLDPDFAAFFPDGEENNGFTDSQSWSNWTPKLGLQYEFDRGQVYAHWTRGFRSGGYNFRITAPTAFEAIAAANGTFAFDEETVDSYEAGIKFQTDDGAFALNFAAFYTDISDLQREVNQASGGTSGSGVAQSIFNTADASILGFEAEARMRVSDNLLFTANLGILDDDYDAILFDISGDGVIDEADLALRLPRVPEYTWGMGLLHELDLGASAIVSRVNFQYRDEVAYTDNNYGYLQTAESLDANIAWETPMDGLTLSIYGRNLLDDVQHGGDTQLPFGDNGLGNGVNRPFDFFPAVGTFSPLMKGRQIGFEAAFEF